MHACMGHRAAAQSLLAIAAKHPTLSAAEHPQKFTNWLRQSEKCSGKYVLAWPVDYESARAKLSSRKKEKSIYGGPKFKVKIST